MSEKVSTILPPEQKSSGKHTVSRRGVLKFIGATAAAVALSGVPTIAQASIPNESNSQENENLLGPFREVYDLMYQQEKEFGYTSFPSIFADLKAINSGVASEVITRLYLQWGEPVEKQQAVADAFAKVQSINFEDNGLKTDPTKKMLELVSQDYPLLILAAPYTVVMGYSDTTLGNNNPRAERGLVVVPQIFENSNHLEQVGVTFHELTHYFGGDLINSNVVECIKPYIDRQVLVDFMGEFIRQTSIKASNLSASRVEQNLRDGHITTIGTSADIDEGYFPESKFSVQQRLVSLISLGEVVVETPEEVSVSFLLPSAISAENFTS